MEAMRNDHKQSVLPNGDQGSNAKPDAYPQTTYATEAQATKVYDSETSLKLYHLTKNHPQSLDELRAHFPDETVARIKQILQGFIEANILELAPNGQYRFLLPNTYLNFSKFKFNEQMEAKKDRSIFNIMKEHAGDRTFWQDQDYFTMDAYMTPEQAKEISQHLDIIRGKAKTFATQNQGKDPSTMKFRRLKFYNMIFGIAMLLLLPFTAFGQITTTGPDTAFVAPTIYNMGGGGYDPTQTLIAYLGGTGDDPKAGIAQIQSWDQVYEINLNPGWVVRNPDGVYTNTLVFEGISPDLARLFVTLWQSETAAFLGSNSQAKGHELTNEEIDRIESDMLNLIQTFRASLRE